MDLIHQERADDALLDELAEASETVDTPPIPIYEPDGETPKLNKDGKHRHVIFVLHRPGAAEGRRFAKFQRGQTSLKSKKIKGPSQQETSTEAIRICLPKFRSATEPEIMALLISTGGYLGDNAKLANACLRLLGQNFDEKDDEEDEQRWASEEQLPTLS